jgi:Holliday junction DNA helicase RuvA
LIEQLIGKITSKEPQHVVLDVNGVGYGLDIPLSTFHELPAAEHTVRLFTFLYVQEETLHLYGFYAEEERDIFEVLINTPGIGPKTSLGILSSLLIDEFARAIASNEIHTLTRIPGIGKKTAERLVLELRGKLDGFVSAPGSQDRSLSSEKRKKIDEAVQALTSLGCRPSVAERAVWKAVALLPEDMTLEDLVKESLRQR